MSAFGITSALLDRLPSTFWPSLCTIKQRTETENAAGEPIASFTVDLSGHTDIPCRMAPLIFTRPTDHENKYVYKTEELTQRQIVLKGYYPNIDAGMGAEIDGTVYNIDGIDFDGNQIMTRLRVEIIEP